MSSSLDRLTIKGFRSLKELKDFPLTKLNVLVGANGAGKSNFVDFFRMLRAMFEGAFQHFVLDSGGGDSCCFDGPKTTPEISAHLVFGENEYRFDLKPTPEGRTLQITNEGALWSKAGGWSDSWSPVPESRLKSWLNSKSQWGDHFGKHHYVAAAIQGWVVYHVHDTSRTAPMRRNHPIHNYRELQPDAGNIAPFLRSIRVSNPLQYALICDMIRQVTPFFDDFILEAEEHGENRVTRLEWRQKGSVFPYQPWQLSDGTIRFICLATALLQPNPPSTIVIDEPELGLHPFALEMLASLIKLAASRTQVIVSTQSPLLLNKFTPEDVIVVDREKGASRLRRLDPGSLAAWLDEYALGELLLKNVIEAYPRYES
jgi:predicted ATPase